MAQTLPDASHLPPGMALLPDGQRMPAIDFFRLHGADLATYPDAQIVISVPPYQADDDVKNALKGIIGVASYTITLMILRNENASKYVASFASGYFGSRIAHWIGKEISHGNQVHIMTVRQMLNMMKNSQ